MKTPSFLMVLTDTGKFAYRREDGVYIVPIRYFEKLNTTHVSQKIEVYPPKRIHPIINNNNFKYYKM